MSPGAARQSFGLLGFYVLAMAATGAGVVGAFLGIKPLQGLFLAIFGVSTLLGRGDLAEGQRRALGGGAGFAALLRVAWAAGGVACIAGAAVIFIGWLSGG